MHLSRDKLYDLVWNEPMSKLSRRFGISDVGLKKICASHGIPTPPRGYWAKLANGKRVLQAPLPPLAESHRGHVEIRSRPRDELAEELSDVKVRTRRLKLEPEDKIRVPTIRPAQLHPNAKFAEQSLRSKEPNTEGFISTTCAGFIYVQISPQSLDRAILIIEAFFSGLRRYSSVLENSSEGAQLSSGRPPFRFCLYSGKDRRPYVPTSQELEEEQRILAQRKSWNLSPSYGKNWKPYRRWDYFANERLLFEITDPAVNSGEKGHLIGRWQDRTLKPLEQQLDSAMMTLAAALPVVKRRRAQEIERVRQAAENEERRRRYAERAARRKRRNEFLDRLADELRALEKYQVLDAFFKRRGIGAGDAPADRLARVLSAEIEARLQQFDVASLDAKIVQHTLLDAEDVPS